MVSSPSGFTKKRRTRSPPSMSSATSPAHRAPGRKLVKGPVEKPDPKEGVGEIGLGHDQQGPDEEQPEPPEERGVQAARSITRSTFDCDKP